MSRYFNILLCLSLLFWPFSAGNAADPVNFSITTSGLQRDTVVTFMGFSSPDAFITFIDNGSVVGTTSANSAGGFSHTLTNQVSGTHSFSIQASDVDGMSTQQYGFILNLQTYAETVVSNILLPTTIAVVTGAQPRVFGNSIPNSQITIFVHSDPFTETANSNNTGSWSKIFNTPLSPGFHTAYGKVMTSGGLQSINSNIVNFEVNCKIADLDCSGRVDLVDFSILMYYWDTGNAVADINSDLIVDLTDFSIMMFYWEG